MNSSCNAILVLALVTIISIQFTQAGETSYLEMLKQRFTVDNDNDVEDSLILRNIATETTVNSKYHPNTKPSD